MLAMSNQKIVGVCFPPKLLEQLDYIRHDVPRSKFIQRLVADHVKMTEFEA